MKEVYFNLKTSFADNPESDFETCGTLVDITGCIPSYVREFIYDRSKVQGYVWESFNLSFTEGICKVVVWFSHYRQ